MTIAIEINNVCNFKCFFCDAKNIKEKTTMSDELFEKIISQVSELDIDLLSMSPVNGEIFTDKNIYNKFEILKKYKLKKVLFHTNLAEQIDFDILENFNFLEIHVSDYSKNGFKEFHKLTRMDISWYDKVIHNKKLLINSSIKYKLLDRSLSNYDYSLVESNNIGIQSNSNKCLTVWAIRIDPYGKVVLCNNSVATKDLPDYLIIGDLNKDSLKDVLSSSKRKQLIKEVVSGNCLDYCKVCNGYLNNPNEPTKNDFKFLYRESKC